MYRPGGSIKDVLLRIERLCALQFPMRAISPLDPLLLTWARIAQDRRSSVTPRATLWLELVRDRKLLVPAGHGVP
jgi:hypothetical protein